ncbi:MAG: hypothetical protein ACFFCW_02120 [Candidatus Hodarchaeota archaeon]
MSSGNRAEQIAKRRAQIPRKYRRLYDRATGGKSLRSSINAQCLECCGWQSREVAVCSDVACPLWSVRPYRSSGNGRDEGFSGAESTNAGKGDDNYGR